MYGSALHRFLGSRCSLLAVAALVVVAASCAQGTTALPGGNPMDQPVSSGPLPSPDPSYRPDELSNTLSPEPAVKLQQTRWLRAQPVDGKPAVLVFGNLTGGPPCAVIGRVDVAETKDSVTISVWIGRQADADCSGPQPEIAFPYVTRVALEHPVGDRAVRDGAA